MNSKTFSIPVIGEYKIGTQTYKCKEGECIALYDVGRGHFTYHTTWYWATTAFYLPDKRSFSFNFGDGIGSQYETTEKALEDFVMIDGKHFKLD